MEKIGITGATGFIGQYLVPSLAGRYRLVCATRGQPAKISQHNILYTQTNGSASSLGELFDGCSAVIHMGASRSTAENERSVSNYYPNVSFAESVFEACRNAGIQNVINISSVAVYPKAAQAPLRENDALRPCSRYGVAKLTVELLADLYNEKNDMAIKSLRLAQVVGLGERNGYMLSVFLKRCLAGEPLLVYGQGAEFREYVYVKDVCRAIMCALSSSDASGVFNVCGETLSNLEMARRYCEVFDNRSGVQLLTDQKESGMAQALNGENAAAELGYRPAYTIRAALEDMRAVLAEGNP